MVKHNFSFVRMYCELGGTEPLYNSINLRIGHSNKCLNILGFNQTSGVISKYYFKEILGSIPYIIQVDDKEYDTQYASL